MATPVESGDLVEVKIYAHSEGQYSINTLHYAVTGVMGSTVTDAAFALSFETAVAPLLKDCMSAGAEYIGISAQIIRPVRRPAVAVNVLQGIGSVVGDVLPRQVAGLLRKKTSIASRHGRGRVYVPFPSEASNTAAGYPLLAYITALSALGAELDDVRVVNVAADSATFTPVVFNRTALTGISITEMQAASTWATVRRRADNRGADRAPF